MNEDFLNDLGVQLEDGEERDKTKFNLQDMQCQPVFARGEKKR
jgi:hypothetical protein